MIRVFFSDFRANKGPNPKVVPEYLFPISHKSPKDYKKNRKLRGFADRAGRMAPPKGSKRVIPQNSFRIGERDKRLS